MSFWKSSCFGPKCLQSELMEDGKQLYDKGEFQAAVSKYCEVLTSLDFENPDIQFSASKIDKFLVPTLYSLSQCYMELKQYHRAATYIKQLLMLRPHHAKAQHLQGIICVQIGDFKSAMKAIKTT
jgi:tetratricopeptide (TPR) repeat protein